MALRLVADSACDLSAEIIQSFDLNIIPLGVEVDGEMFLDNVTLRSVDLMQKMRDGSSVKTTQVTSYFFEQQFTKYAKDGDDVLYIAFSTGLSGSFNSALIAEAQVLEQYPDFNLTAIDTKCASLGYGLVVYQAAKMLREGATKQQIIAAVEDIASRMQHIFTVDDLEYLMRGGRVSRAAALVGGLLGIKPVMDVDTEGKLRPLEKARGRKKSIARLAEIIGERCGAIGQSLVGISHGDDMPAVEELKSLLQEKYGCKEFMVNNLGCAVGGHAGPGTLAVFCVGELPK